jgi:predicted nucleotidyltransferase
MNGLDLIMKEKEAILALGKRHHARNLRIFGSIARGDDKPDSDIDFLADFEVGSSLVDLVGLKLDLEELLHRHVDIVSENSLHWFIRDNVLREARPLS